MGYPQAPNAINRWTRVRTRLNGQSLPFGVIHGDIKTATLAVILPPDPQQHALAVGLVTQANRIVGILHQLMIDLLDDIALAHAGFRGIRVFIHARDHGAVDLGRNTVLLARVGVISPTSTPSRES